MPNASVAGQFRRRLRGKPKKRRAITSKVMKAAQTMKPTPPRNPSPCRRARPRGGRTQQPRSVRRARRPALPIVLRRRVLDARDRRDDASCRSRRSARRSASPGERSGASGGARVRLARTVTGLSSTTRPTLQPSFLPSQATPSSVSSRPSAHRFSCTSSITLLQEVAHRRVELVPPGEADAVAATPHWTGSTYMCLVTSYQRARCRSPCR